MDRREFFQRIAFTAAAAQSVVAAELAETPETTGHTLQCEFQYGGTAWKVYEDLSRRDGPITFVPRVMGRR